jgi:hypothetical protein
VPPEDHVVFEQVRDESVQGDPLILSLDQKAVLSLEIDPECLGNGLSTCRDPSAVGRKARSSHVQTFALYTLRISVSWPA